YTTTPVSLFNNFTVPFRSEIHSAFGASALLFYGILSIFLFRRLFTLKKALPLFIIVVALMLVTMGDDAFFHGFLWNNLPLYSSFRTPGRISLLLPFYIILIYSLYLKEISIINNERYVLGSHVVLSFIYFCLSLLSIFYLPLPAHYTPEDHNNVSHGAEILFVAFNSLLIISIGIYITQSSIVIKRISAAVSIISLILSTGGLLYKGTWVIPYKEAVSNILSLEQYNQRIKGLGKFAYGSESKNVRNQIDSYKFDADHARVLPAITYVNSLNEAYKHLKTHGDKDSIVIADSAQQPGTEYLCEKNCNYKITRSCHTYNKFEYFLENNAGGIAKFNIPYSSNWVATLDGVKEKILKANGFEMAIVIPDDGEHKLTLLYKSWSFTAGLIISLTTLAIILILGVRRLDIKAHFKLIIIFLIVVFSVGIASSRNNWLYNGKCLPQEYSWDNSKSN
ncbi:YfhO family protein, partial [Pseudomonadota bacterium]